MALPWDLLSFKPHGTCWVFCRSWPQNTLFLDVFGGCFTFGWNKSKVSSTASAAQDCWRIKNSLPLGWANMVSIERSYHNDPSKHKHQTAIVVGTGHAHQAWPQRLPKALAIQEPGCSIRPLKIGLPKRNIVSQPPFFSGYVSFRCVCVCVCGIDDKEMEIVNVIMIDLDIKRLHSKKIVQCLAIIVSLSCTRVLCVEEKQLRQSMSIQASVNKYG